MFGDKGEMYKNDFLNLSKYFTLSQLLKASNRRRMPIFAEISY